MDPTSSTRPSRDDCWSEGATSALIEAWGNRYINANRGNLRQKDWKEVADAVNGRSDGMKPCRSDVQCKNRIDTLKKKYKVEKTKTMPSTWPFYDRLDYLIGSSTTTTTTSAVKKTNAVNLTVKPKPNPIPGGVPISRDSEDGEDEEDEGVGFDERVVKKEHRMEDVDYSDGAACRELARAVLKLGEIYERIESAKQQQMMELEKQRMEFTKELEFERMNMIIEAQLEIEKRPFKRGRFKSGSGKKP